MSGLLVAAGPAPPDSWQAGVVALGLALLALSLATAWAGLAKRNPLMQPPARAAALLAVLLDLGVVLYRNLVQAWACPVEDNFDSVLLFVVMLGGLLFYIGPRRSAGVRRGGSAADLVILPLMILMQVVAAIIPLGGFRQFAFAGAWRPIHLGAMLVSLLPLTAAAVAGVMYLWLDRALRRKSDPGAMGAVPSLERLDRLMHHAAGVGFVLLTISIFAGVLLLARQASASWVKLAAAGAAWTMYLVSLSTRLAPRLGGRPVAAMCIAALGLVLLAYVAAHWQ